MRTNVVIGGGSGMGQAVVEAFAPTGRVLVADRDIDAARRVAKAAGASADAVECDVTDDAQIAAVVTHVDHLGALVLTAGLSPQMAPGRSILEVNLVGSAKVLDAFAPKVEQGSVAVCLASIAGHTIAPTGEVLEIIDDPLSPGLVDRLLAAGVDADDPGVAYVYSKFGVIRMAARLARAWGAAGGRILSLSPGVIDTPMGRLATENLPAIDERMASWPIPRLGRPDEIASVVMFLCSEQASYMTGSDVLVDGGSVREWREQRLTPAPPRR
jgi:NAD(P)-dependent dehydrogenase (short-subunit alcohol dehydrogenase family)